MAIFGKHQFSKSFVTWLQWCTISAINVHSRQQLIEQSIGAFPEETEAYELTWKLAIGSPIALIIATFIQYCLYELYNRWFHPFADLLKGYEKDKKKNIRLEEMQNFLWYVPY